MTRHRGHEIEGSPLALSAIRRSLYVLIAIALLWLAIAWAVSLA